jgi:hypothetical protein
MTEASIKALANLRDTGNFEWYVIPLFVFVLYIYINEAGKKNWGAVLAGLTFWGAEFIWEMFNSLVLHFTQYAGMWSAPGKTAYLIYSGLNIEISLMFSIAGLLVVKSLPDDRTTKVFGFPRFLLAPFSLGLLAVFIEVLLNQANALVWDYSWWSWPNIWLIIVVYCGPFILVAWLDDRIKMKTKVIMLGTVWILAIAFHLLFAVILKWV